jgi:membrane protein DedA with SNARE-associated domain
MSMEALAASIMAFAGGNPCLSAFLFLLSFGYCSPIPEELALVGVGFALRSAGVPYPLALAVAFVALALSDAGCYSFARLLGPRLVRLKPLARLFHADRILAAEKYFAKKGTAFIFTSRFFFGLRSIATLGAGFLRLPFHRFLAPSLPALAIGASSWLAVGYVSSARLGSVFETAPKFLSALGILAAIAVAVVAIGRVAAHRLRSGTGEA